MNLMSNEFTQQVSDIVVYGKEEANRLQNDHIEPEHLLDPRYLFQMEQQGNEP